MRQAVDEATIPTNIPFWQMVAFALVCGLAGEMYRADSAGMPPMQIIKRALIRSGASVGVGICALLICLHVNADVYLSGAITGLTSLAGAEAAIAIYVAWIRRKVTG